jgi:DNA mismatch endonuclease (patch repair protein)
MKNTHNFQKLQCRPSHFPQKLVINYDGVVFLRKDCTIGFTSNAMADIFSKEKRSEIMSRIRGKHTGPELVVRRALFAQGFRFRVHVKELPGKPDIVLPKYNSVVIVDGCFWHGHRKCKLFKMPKTRVTFWRQKIEGNRARDLKNQRKLRTLGWKVIRVWECQLSARRYQKTIERIIEKLQTN